MSPDDLAILREILVKHGDLSEGQASGKCSDLGEKKRGKASGCPSGDSGGT